MLISERIYELMKAQKITQLELSKRTGISQSTICDWRRKGTNPSADKIMIICEVLGVTPYDILEGTVNTKMKTYTAAQQVDVIVLEKDSPEYTLVECYRNAGEEDKKRLVEYVEGLL